MTSIRRSDFDVTNSVQVSSPAAVLGAVEALYRPTWPGLSMEPLQRAFEHFERLFAGKVPGYHGVDTVYHDRQHTLDITLALALVRAASSCACRRLRSSLSRATSAVRCASRGRSGSSADR